MMTLRMVLLGSAVGLALGWLAVPAAAGELEDYRSALEEFLAENGLAGGTLFVRGPETEIEVVAGMAETGTRRPVTPDTRFYIASTGKMMVAAAVLAHVEKGDLDLDARVWPLVRDLPGIDALEGIGEVTLRQLLNHTSGLADYLDDSFVGAALLDMKRQWSEVEALAFAYGEPAYGEPGEIFEYSNSNYVLLGHILKNRSADLEAALRESVFVPSGMLATTVGASAEEADLAHGYAGETGDTDVSQLSWASVLADGPLVSTARDVAGFLQALMREQRILKADLLEEMLAGSKQDDSYGLGMANGGDDWGDWYGHSGSYDGFEADARYYPDADLVLVYTVNGNSVTDTDLLDLAAGIYFDN
ncbi:serine hydrolase domain-containing protein [Hoeflea alexandrii]